MKPYLLAVVFIMANTFVFAQTNLTETVYLSNGSVIKCIVLEQTKETIKIQTYDGSIFVYDFSQVDKIVKNISETNNIIPVEKPVANPDIIAALEIGSLIEFYDGSKGIVFYLDGKGHGLAVSMSETPKTLWQTTSSWRDCIDLESIPNSNTNFQMGLGVLYCDAAISDLGPMNLPAIAKCRSIGPNWYLPSVGELRELLVVANKSQGRFGPIGKAIVANGGESIHNYDINYFSCSEIDNTDVYAISAKGSVCVEKKYKNCRCRAIRMF